MEANGLYPCLPTIGTPSGTSRSRHRAKGAMRRHRKRPSARWIIRFGIIFAVFAISTISFALSRRGPKDGNALSSESVRRFSRNLLSTSGNGSGGGLESCGFETEHFPALFVVIYAITTLIFFIALAIICDDFFVPSLEVISERLDLSEDVAGATFMAAGSSAPELFTSLAGVTVESDVGVGTIVGSAVFNILIIIALSSVLAGQLLQLDWRPLLRDSIWYGVSIACFIIFAWDGIIELYEAIILLVLYVLYIVIMKFNSTIMELTSNGCRRGKVEPIESGGSQGELAEAPGNEVMMTGVQTQKAAPLSDRKLSIISTGSGVLTRTSSSHKHIFHHVKHGELASNFTSSTMDVKQKGDDDPYHGAHMGSRIGSLAGSVIMEIGSENTAYPAIQQQHEQLQTANTHPETIAEREGPGGLVIVTDSSNDSRPSSANRSSPNGELQFAMGVDAESLGGGSLDFGSRSHLIIPYSGFNDADSGIHSVQGITPITLDPCDPNCDPSLVNSDPDPSDLKAMKRHSISVIHHEHVLPLPPSKMEDDPAAEPEIIEEDEIIDEELTLQPIPCLPAIGMYYPDREVLQTRCGCLRYALKWLMFFISFPFMCAFTWTIPNCSNPKYRRFYIASFVLSIFWIAVLSFAMITLVSRAGCILEVDPYVMGLLIVSVGTSVPDALSSILVARDGFGDMAVSNAIGSNVFDIDLGLGLPFLISILIFNKPLRLLSDVEFAMLASGEMMITPHAKFGFILLGILLLTLVVFTLVRFKLNKVVGVTFVLVYILFITYALIQETVCHYSC